MEGAYAVNELLAEAMPIGDGLLNGPEDVAIDAWGRLYCGSVDGVIHRILPDGTVEVFAETGGTPLGLEFDTHGNLIVCEPSQGLLSIDPGGTITLLTSAVEGTPITYANDVDIALDGIIYFSDSSTKFGFHEAHLDMLEARPHGRLISYDPHTGVTQVLARDLYFANGVALSQAEDFVLVSETFRYRITRYWLQGPKAGTSEIFVDNLPGMPDGLFIDDSGTLWIAFFAQRSYLLDTLLHPSPDLKMMASFVNLEDVQGMSQPYGLIVAMNEAGEPQASYHDPLGELFSETTSVTVHDGALYIGNLSGHNIGHLTLY